MTRYFLNSPMLATMADVERYADARGALRVGGYTADDGTHRANVELSAGEAARARREQLELDANSGARA